MSSVEPHMRPTIRIVLAALLVGGLLVVAGCAGPSATNNSTVAGNGTITTIDPADTPAANDSAGGEDVDAGERDYSLASVDAVG